MKAWATSYLRLDASFHESYSFMTVTFKRRWFP
jgi:hypothetical protein